MQAYQADTRYLFVFISCKRFFINLSRSVIVATSVLQTGANLPATLLSLFYGYAYSPEGVIQGAGRSGREPGTTGKALLIATKYSESEALGFGKQTHRGLLQVSELLKSDDFETALMNLFDQPLPQEIAAHSQRSESSLQIVAQSQSQRSSMSTQSQPSQLLHSDLSKLAHALQNPSTLPDVGPDDCFDCGCASHWSADCPLKNKPMALGRQLYTAGCCTRCGLPKGRITGTLLHTCDSLGRFCSMPTFFIKSLSIHARAIGKQPHEHLSQLLQAGISSLITAYAALVPSQKRPRPL